MLKIYKIKFLLLISLLLGCGPEEHAKEFNYIASSTIVLSNTKINEERMFITTKPLVNKVNNESSENINDPNYIFKVDISIFREIKNKDFYSIENDKFKLKYADTSDYLDSNRNTSIIKTSNNWLPIEVNIGIYHSITLEFELRRNITIFNKAMCLQVLNPSGEDVTIILNTEK